MSADIIDVLIVGAGPVGLVLANELARFGVNIRIVEKNTTSSRWSKSLLITSRTMDILENIGLSKEILSQVTIMEGVDIHFSHQRVASINMSLENPTIRYPFPFILPQPDVEAAFEHVLEERGYQVERAAEVVDLEVRKDHVEVTLKNGEIFKARFVVGCDGAHSFVRHSQSDWKFEGRPVDLLWAQCDGTIADTQIHSTRAGVFFGANGFSVRIPVCHHQRRFRSIVHVPPELLGTSETPEEFKYGRIEGQKLTLEQFNGFLQGSMGPQFAEISDPTWLTYFIVQERIVNNLRHSSRLFLAGDAAHCHSPAGGQGMNMGIQDAHNLAWKLALVVKDQAVDTEALLESYTAERLPIIRRTVGMTSRLLQGTKIASSKLAWVLRLVVATAANFRWLQQAMIPGVLQTSLSIAPTPNGILSRQSTKILKPGTMLPDPAHPIFSLTKLRPNTEGTTHLLPLLLESYKHIALFIIADHALHEPHPLFQKFKSICKLFRQNLRPVILARTYRIGGLRKPDWSDDDILFLATNSTTIEKGYGLNGKKEMGLFIIRPDGYIAYSDLVDLNGNALDIGETWLEANLVKS